MINKTKKGILWIQYLPGVSIVIKNRFTLKNAKIEEMINKFVLNAILNHVGMSLIICSNKEMLYEIDEISHPDWSNKVPWYNTDICSKLHGKLFEYFITNERAYRYHLMCSIISHDKKQPSYEDEDSSI